MSILISLLLNLLVYFIEQLIKNWISQHGENPPPACLTSNKMEFLDKVKWRIWLGPGRLRRAGHAYDLAVANYSNLPKNMTDTLNVKPKELATMTISGIAQELQEEEK